MVYYSNRSLVEYYDTLIPRYYYHYRTYYMTYVIEYFFTDNNNTIAGRVKTGPVVVRILLLCVRARAFRHVQPAVQQDKRFFWSVWDGGDEMPRNGFFFFFVLFFSWKTVLCCTLSYLAFRLFFFSTLESYLNILHALKRSNKLPRLVSRFFWFSRGRYPFALASLVVEFNGRRVVSFHSCYLNAKVNSALRRANKPDDWPSLTWRFEVSFCSRNASRL